MYCEDELLILSNIQHFCFCPRQWQLISLEQLWEENHLTAQGRILHDKVDQPSKSARIGDIITMRSVPLVSYKLGLVGISDAVELTPALETSTTSFVHPKYPGKWDAKPIEYKKGRPKRHNADILQLCAEAICLEEMYGIEIPEGAIFYGETKRHLNVPLDKFIRKETENTAHAMHHAFTQKKTIPPKYSSRCKSCSLYEICLPKIAKQKSAKYYLQKNGIL